MNRHQFEQLAKGFRAGRVTLSEFADKMFPRNGSSAPADSGTTSDPPSASTDGASNGLQTTAQMKSLFDRNAESHKGSYGKVLAVGGSKSMPGAISMAGMAALRTGSGLVAIATSGDAVSAVSAFSPCYMVNAFSSLPTGSKTVDRSALSRKILQQLESRIAWADVIAIGPGLSVADYLKHVVTKLYLETAKPLLVDADALTLLKDSDPGRHHGPRILTPHAGEFSRLVKTEFKDREEAEAKAIELAKSCNVIIVLKGHRTLVTDGDQTFHNSTGNPGMATAGSGDVLTGMIASLIGQKQSPFDACCAAVELHGMAGDLAAKRMGQPSVVATDLIECLPEAILAAMAGC